MGLIILSQPLDTLEGVKFSGNTLPTRQLSRSLRAQIKLPLDSLILKEDLHALKELYRAEGFLDAVVEYEVLPGSRSGWVNIEFKLDEGVRVRIGQIGFSGNRAFPESKLLSWAGIRSGEYLREAALARAQTRILDLYHDNGYPYIKIERIVNRKDATAGLQFELTEGPLTHLVRIQVEGNERVASRVVVGIAGIKFGERFSQSRLRRAQARLYASQLFSQVGYRLEGRPTSSRLTLIWEVEELPPRIISGGVGYETPDRLLLSLEWQHLNILNQGQTMMLAADFAPNLARDYRLKMEGRYTIPYYWGVPVDFVLHPFYHQEVEGGLKQRRWGLEGEFGREVLPDLRLAGVVRYKKVFLFPRDQLSNPEGITNSIGFNLLWDLRDDFFNPRRGGYYLLSLERSGGFLKGENDLRRIVIDLREFLIVPALRVRLGWVIPYGRTDEVPYYEAFELGGRNSMRGYPERSIGPVALGAWRFGDFLLNLNFELRSPYYRRLSGVLFFDLGSLSSGPAALFSNDYYGYSAGLGVRISTPIGPLRFDYGKRLRAPMPKDWGAIYFGLLQAF